MDEDEVRSRDEPPGDEDFLVFSSGQRVRFKDLSNEQTKP